MQLILRSVRWALRRLRDALALVGLAASLLVLTATPGERAYALRRAQALVASPLPTVRCTAARPLTDAPAIAWPVPERARLTSCFGDRVHPITHATQWHNGVDLAVPLGTTVRAAQAGTVARVGEDAISGRYVIVEHDGGLRTSYAHLSAVGVESGQLVDQSEALGRSGSTGRSTGPHLHFSAALDGRWVDPRRLARRGGLASR